MLNAPDCINTLRVISFDLDDTFWDCAPAIANAEQALFDWHVKHTPRITSAHNPASLAQFRSRVREQNPHLGGCVTAMRLHGLRILLDQFDYPQSLADEAFDVFYRARSEVVIYPRVIELLQSLKERYSLAAITNGNADLEHIGIAQYFDQVYAADLTLKAKPHSDMFHRCLEHFGVTGNQMLHIGDNPVADIAGGLAAGVRTLWFNQHGVDWSEQASAPHYEARSIAEIQKLLS
ncbi:MAG: HAD family hydrolase [Granulosicoccus sp.]